MYELIEIALAVLIGLFKFCLRNCRPLFGLALGAGVGLAFGLSIAKYGGVDKWTILMFMAIGAVVLAPVIVSFLNGIAPKA